VHCLPIHFFFKSVIPKFLVVWLMQQHTAVSLKFFGQDHHPGIKKDFLLFFFQKNKQSDTKGEEEVEVL